MSETDAFSAAFDTIAIDRATAPSPAVLAHALEVAAPPRPGFALIDDAGGRFIVDADFGIVSLADEALLQRERNSMHTVALRVVEASGETYVLEMTLRITGLVPQMVGQEEFAPLAALTAEPAPPALTLPAECTQAWPLYAVSTATLGKAALVDEDEAFGSVLPAPLSASATGAILLSAEVPLSPAPAHADWSL